MSDEGRERALAERIKAWREDERAGYDQAIDLLGTAEDVLNGLEADYAAALSAARQEERERVYRECSDVARRRGADEVADILRSAANIEQGRAAAIRARGEAGQ
ncbi:MAG: hypothetical protein KBA95_01945 [Acidobacteria bacterium]|nr:hypothetical protein [Acidobacteriota bacterium]